MPTWHAMLLALALQCQEGSLGRYACTCSFLTDMDGESEQKVEICATAGQAESEAAGCAQTAAHATVQSCRCQSLTAGCSKGLCQVRP